MASCAYEEQEGKNRHGDMRQENVRWYHSMADSMRRCILDVVMFGRVNSGVLVSDTVVSQQPCSCVMVAWRSCLLMLAARGRGPAS